LAAIIAFYDWIFADHEPPIGSNAGFGTPSAFAPVLAANNHLSMSILVKLIALLQGSPFGVA
jgi:hypothetical protein